MSFVPLFLQCCVVLLFVSEERFCSLWHDLQKDKPELLGILEGVLVNAVSHLQDSTRERDSLEQALRRYRWLKVKNSVKFTSDATLRTLLWFLFFFFF